MPIFSLEGKTVLFVHIPRTGGVSIERHLAAYGTASFDRKLDHDLGLRCIPGHFHGALLEGLFDASLFDHVFMVVRDPIARTLSDYGYYVRRKELQNNPPNISFWLRYRFFRASRNPYYMDNHFRPQSEFECFDATVYRFEDGLSQCITDMNSKLGTQVSEELPVLNPSPPLDIRLSEADRALIHRRYEADYERFEYPKT